MVKENIQNAINFNQSNIIQLKELCSPLAYLQIDDFTYARYSFKGKVIRLDTNTTYNKLALEHAVTDKLQVIIDKLAYQQYAVFTYLPDIVVCQCMSNSGFKNFMSVHYKRKQYIEGFIVFSSSSTKDLSQFYMNNICTLEKFFQYFKSRVAEIIKIAEDQKILLNSDLTFYSQLNDNNNQIGEFIKQIKLKKLSICSDNEVNQITQKEALCMMYLSQGLSYKTIGDKMNISPRTVETYIINLKHKLNIYSTEKLRECFIENHLEKIVDSL